MMKRTRGRELALQYLYMHDVLEGRDLRSIEDFLVDWEDAGDDEEVRRFASRLIELALASRDDTDGLMAKIAHNWRVERMAVTDRNIIRLACAELKYEADTPHRVILDEAVGLAKRFSTDESGAFVNGVLDKLREAIRPETVGAPDADPEAPVGPDAASPPGTKDRSRNEMPV